MMAIDRRREAHPARVGHSDCVAHNVRCQEEKLENMLAKEL